MRNFWLFTFILFLAGPALYSESIFISDGRILEGIIKKEDEHFLYLGDKSGKIMKIERKDILRTLFTEQFKNKVFISLKNNDLIEAFVVDEDSESIAYRLDLTVNDEVKLLKKDIRSISNEKPAEKIIEKIVEKEIIIKVKDPEVNFFYIGALNVLESGYDSKYEGSFGSFYAAALAYKRTLKKNLFLYSQFNFFLNSRKAELMNYGAIFSTVHHNKSYDILLGLDYYIPIYSFIKIGATVTAGPNISALSVTGAGASGEYYVFGYKIALLAGVEVDFFIPVRISGYYEYGANENLLFKSFGVQALMNVFSF